MDPRSRPDRVTRRQFVRLAAAAGLGTALTACGGKEAAAPPRAQASTPLPPPPGGSYLAVARGSKPKPITQAALAAIGGIERFVKSGDDVIVKPNSCVDFRTFEYAATTNPEGVASPSVRGVRPSCFSAALDETVHVEPTIQHNRTPAERKPGGRETRTCSASPMRCDYVN